MKFEDHFSKQAASYAQYRPHYPVDLYAYLASMTPQHALAWDCATGSGQAALGLIQHFDQVVATDASAEQIRRVAPHDRIVYRVEPAEQTTLAPCSVDLVTVAVAVHWFDFSRFYAEVRRVTKPGGILAVWTYHRPAITPVVDELIASLELEVLGDYWPERIRYIQEYYQTLPFPFLELTPPAFTIQAAWSLDQLIGFVNSWSGVRRYEEARGAHPIEVVWDRLLSAWGEREQVRPVRWPLHMRVGRVDLEDDPQQ
jgi:SAM-dependent methyltransferase